MGVHTAYALLMVLFVAHNVSVRNKYGKINALAMRGTHAALSAVSHDRAYATTVRESSCQAKRECI